MSKWIEIIDFVNSHEIFTHGELRKKLYDKRTTTDYQYINYIHNAGFLKRLSRGRYQRLIFIPSWITSIKMQRIGYNIKERTKVMRKIKLDKLFEIIPDKV